MNTNKTVCGSNSSPNVFSYCFQRDWRNGQKHTQSCKATAAYSAVHKPRYTMRGKPMVIKKCFKHSIMSYGKVQLTTSIISNEHKVSTVQWRWHCELKKRKKCSFNLIKIHRSSIARYTRIFIESEKAFTLMNELCRNFTQRRWNYEGF